DALVHASFGDPVLDFRRRWSDWRESGLLPATLQDYATLLPGDPVLLCSWRHLSDRAPFSAPTSKHTGGIFLEHCFPAPPDRAIRSDATQQPFNRASRPRAGRRF